MSEKKEYLGDSVYADIEYGYIKLTTENDIVPSNTIYIERQVLMALISFLQRNGVVGAVEF